MLKALNTLEAYVADLRNVSSAAFHKADKNETTERLQ